MSSDGKENADSPVDNVEADAPEAAEVTEAGNSPQPASDEQNAVETTEAEGVSPEKESEPEAMEVDESKKEDENVEKFDGKILYNPDGSAYIIEDEEAENDLPKQEGCIVDTAKTEANNSEVGYPQIANAFVVSRSTAYYNSLYGQAFVKMLQEKNVPETPVVHSYRVYSARSREAGAMTSSNNKEPAEKPSLPSVVPVKPILMCFICKLSFGCAKTFAGHCGDQHSLSLTEEEQSILDVKNSSAILQNVGKDPQEVSVSFLEPEVSPSQSGNAATSGLAALAQKIQAANQQQGDSNANAQPMSPGAIANLLSVAAAVQKAKSGHLGAPSSEEESAPAGGLMRPPSGSSARDEPEIISESPLRRSPTNLTRYSSPSPSSSSSFPATSLPLPLPPGLPGGPPATNANMLQGTTIGACPDHVNGRPTGVECAKCDLILRSTQLAGGSGWNVSRNSCKTLKCPKCNWHYKYQETLEIHMKEKHPESETTCIYCITGQQHPRLARGETYTCGYKPYRCEVCNYSTTTKGNLSIHMQSDKHLNNMQELQNGGGPSSGGVDPTKGQMIPSSNSGPRSMALPPTMSPSKALPLPPINPPAQPPKPNWRCDVCNYETNVARNLRIHMTSEKHTHNVMALSQQHNAKNLPPLPGLGGLPGLPGLDPKQLLQIQQGLGLLGGPPPTSSSAPSTSEAALADLAFNQAVLAQMLSGGGPPGGLPPGLGGPDLNIAAMAAAMAGGAGGNNSNNDDIAEVGPPDAPNSEDQNAKSMFSCCVCREFGCDNLDDLSNHLSTDRSRTRENEVSIVVGGNYFCQLCTYKTNLKANFQLHCKTDKHLQRLSHVNHIKEGGPANEWKLRFLTSINPVELRCNACDFYTNSPHKLQVHVANQQHQAAAVLFTHLQKMEATIDEDRRSYECILCKFSSRGKPGLMGHVRTMKHLQMEQIHQLQKRAEGNMAQTEIGDIFQVTESSSGLTNNDDENKSARGDEEIDSTQSAPADGESSFTCPLCSEKFGSSDSMEEHAMSVHSVNSEGLQRLQSLINGSHWLNNKKDQGSNDQDKEESGETSGSKGSPSAATSSGKESFSYSMEKYLDPNRPFKCDACKESFTQKSILLVHYNSVIHLNRLRKNMLEQQKEQGGSGGVDPTTSTSGSTGTSSATPEKSSKGSSLEALLGNIRGDKQKGSTEDEEAKPFKCNICKVAYSQGSTLDIHIRSVLHQTKASKLQEMILQGQLDLSKPLIEQPDPQTLQEQHKKMIADMLLSPKSLNSTGSSNPQTSPLGGQGRSSSPMGAQSSSSPQSSPLANIHALMGGSNKDGSPTGGDNEEMVKKMLANLTSTPTSGDDKKQPPVGLKNILQNLGLLNNDNKRQREVSDDKDDVEAKRVKSEDGSKVNGDDSPPKDRSGTPASTKDEVKPPGSLQEMQEALQKAMMLQQMSNPMMMQMAQLQGLNPLVAMNLYPPLIPPNLLKQQQQGGSSSPNPTDILSQLTNNPLLQGAGAAGGAPPGLDPKLLALMSGGKQPPVDPPKNLAQMMSLLGQGPPGSMPPLPGLSPGGDGKLPLLPPPPPTSVPGPTSPFPRPEAPGGIMLPQQPLSQGGMQEGKRARTRISDDQLKILRGHFDINNSPTEDTLNKLSAQTGLPLKVIKHWFRNTLFKERQKNKDSPYNFNNAPTTKLNLEEYEKTGEPKVTPLNPNDQAEYIKQEALKKEAEAKSELLGSPSKKDDDRGTPESLSHRNATTPTKAPTPSLPESPSPLPLPDPAMTLQRLLGGHLTPGALGPQPNPPMLPNFPAFPLTTSSGGVSTTPPMPEYLTTLARQNPRPQSPQSVGSQGKRANRTRFTDYQIKVLQEFFENNAYPKDDDLEYLSKLLGLSPRVIVVWFQNARQKARKIYENQPAENEGGGGSPGDENSGRFTRTSGCNYQCKKCLLVFQRYYELIRHQKQHCYKEEDAKRSAQAQKAAAQAAAQFVGPPPPLIPHSEESRSSAGEDNRSITSPAMVDRDDGRPELADLPRNPLLNFPPNTPFGMLQQQALAAQRQLQVGGGAGGNQGGDAMSGDEFDDNDSLASNPSSKRKLSDDGDMDEETLQTREKRLRTTILPEQLDFLYQKYQVESNPSRKMLEQIAAEVGLRKRVVQVWFQNTRARERKGQLRVSGQAIHKKCPFCPAVFKVRTALEAHLVSKHPETPAGSVDIDALPTIESSSEDGDSNPNNHLGNGLLGGLPGGLPPLPPLPPLGGKLGDSPFNVSEHLASLLPNTTSASAMDLQSSMRKYYEDTMKRFMNDLADQKQTHPEGSVPQASLPEGALDLTSSFNTDDGMSDHGDSDPNNKSGDLGGANNNGGNKRFRTQMSGVQVKMMKAVFEAYKTPTMTECSNLGREIGLQKRVVQVWFQNARAKEKRARLQLQQATGREPEPPLPPEGCPVCPGFTFGHKFAIQDHLFTKPHLENLKLALEAGRYDPESPGAAMAAAAAALQSSGNAPSGTNGAQSPPGSAGENLSMLVNNSSGPGPELLDINGRANPRMLMQV